MVAASLENYYSLVVVCQSTFGRREFNVRDTTNPRRRLLDHMQQKTEPELRRTEHGWDILSVGQDI